MKNKRFYFILTVGAAMIGLLLLSVWLFKPPPPPHMVDYRSKEAQMVMSNLQAQAIIMRSNTVAGRMPVPVSGFFGKRLPSGSDQKPAPITNSIYPEATNWPEDSRPEVKALYQFAKIAKLYKFDPQVTYYAINTNQVSVSIETATHDVEVDARDNKIPFLTSKADCMTCGFDHPDAKQSWTQSRGEWNQPALIEQTLVILNQFGFTNTIQAVLHGRKEVSIPDYTAMLPDGKNVTFHPFATVILHDSIHDEQSRVRAEYRLGEDGLPYLVRWSAW
jgi:hypothetical protein